MIYEILLIFYIRYLKNKELNFTGVYSIFFCTDYKNVSYEYKQVRVQI